MRFGLTLSYPDLGNDPGFLKHLAQATEEAGFDHLLGAEHVIGGHPDRLRDEKVHTYDVPYHEPFVLFGFLGAVTSRIELVTGILILPQRQTALVAKQAAELDLLTGGRLRLGVGVGRNWMEYEALNEDFSNRGARIEEQVEVLRRLWTEELVTFDGDWHHLDRMGLNPMPVQRPIPIWMGSYRGKVVDKVIRRIARLADGWFPQLAPGDELTEVVARLHRHAAEAGRDPATLGIEGATSLRRDDDAQRWIDEADAFRALGATHLRLVTAFAGLETPEQHLDAALRWLAAVRPGGHPAR
jgi:probable F420-dependent oxidoreductase